MKLHVVPNICSDTKCRLSSATRVNEKCRKAGLLQQEAAEQQQEVKILLLISSKLAAATNSLFPHIITTGCLEDWKAQVAASLKENALILMKLLSLISKKG